MADSNGRKPRIHRNSANQTSISVISALKDQIQPISKSFKGLFSEKVWRSKIVYKIDTNALKERKEQIAKIDSSMPYSEFQSKY